MFLPRWVVALLFLTSVLSTGAVLYLLAQKNFEHSVQNSPHATIILSPTPLAQSPVPLATQSDALMANAKWSTKEQKELNIKLDYPGDWSVRYEDNNLVLTDPTSAETSIVISRQDKSSKTVTTTVIASQRKTTLEKDSAISEVTSTAQRVDDAYEGTLFQYKKSDVSTKELVFATRSYVYTVLLTPYTNQLDAIFSEVIKSIDII